MCFSSASSHAALNDFLKSFVAQALPLAPFYKALESEGLRLSTLSAFFLAFKLITGD
jgi:hypothetical protein